MAIFNAGINRGAWVQLRTGLGMAGLIPAIGEETIVN
jgi:hypothetical protein